MKTGWVAAAIACTLCLSACGGGGGSSEGPPQFSGTPTGTNGTSTAPPAGSPTAPPDTSGTGGSTGEDGSSGSGTGTAPPPSGTITTTSTVAMIVALPGPPGGMQLGDLNDNGHAAGIATTGSVPMSVSPQNHHLANADNFGAASPYNEVGGNNGAGVVTGWSGSGPQYSRTHWTWDGARRTELPRPTMMSFLSLLWNAGIDDQGRVAIQLYRSGVESPARYIAARATPAGYTLVPHLAVEGESTYIHAQSNGGYIVGATETNDGAPLYLFIWRPDGPAVRLMHAGNLRGCSCGAADINDNGTVLLQRDGGGELVTTETRQVLPKIDSSWHYFRSMNNTGDIVGSFSSGGFLFTAGQIHELNHFTQAATLGWTLLDAHAINNRRQILGRGTFNGLERWYLLTLK